MKTPFALKTSSDIKKEGGISLSLEKFKIKGSVAADNKSATIISDGPWAGVRGAGISLGFRF